MSRRGTVRISQDATVELPWHRFIASWQLATTGEELEVGPGWSEISPAVDWGRARAPVVLLLLGEHGSHIYNAGEKDAAGHEPRWHLRHTSSAEHLPQYGGEVFIHEQLPVIRPLPTFSAVWVSEDGAVLDHREGFPNIEDALEWARARGNAAFVAELPRAFRGTPTYQIRRIDL